MSRFNQAVVTAVRQETPNSKVITLDCPEFSHSEFKPGQYITVRFDIDGQDVRRSYSVCNLPSNGTYSVGVKKLPQGLVSTYMNEKLSSGHSVEVMAPEGNFVLQESATPLHHVFFAAGSGITPIMSMIAHIAAKGKDKATLFYGNRSTSETMFKSRLDELAASSGIRVVYVLSDGSGPTALERGRIDFSKTFELMNTHLDASSDKVFYVCGPTGMMTAVENALGDNGVDSARIIKEHFVTPDQELDAAPEQVLSDAPDFAGQANMKVTLDGEEVSIPLSTNGDVILDAVLDSGLDAPFSCKGGVCTTCRAQVTSGRVKMDTNYALTDSELEEGFILTCQAHPCTEEVEITYDI